MVRYWEDSSDDYLVVFKGNFFELTIHDSLSLESRGGLLNLSSQHRGRGGEMSGLENGIINLQLQLVISFLLSSSGVWQRTLPVSGVLSQRMQQPSFLSSFIWNKSGNKKRNRKAPITPNSSQYRGKEMQETKIFTTTSCYDYSITYSFLTNII